MDKAYRSWADRLPGRVSREYGENRFGHHVHLRLRVDPAENVELLTEALGDVQAGARGAPGHYR